jgi:hypothetical protein
MFRGLVQIDWIFINKMTLADPERGYYAGATYPGFLGMPKD